MKKILLFVGIFCILGLQTTFAQKYALIDMEYILKKIPAYENANKQLETTSAKWQSEIDALSDEVE
jgi:outer membrane protein